jgi:HEAT repeat protein
MIIKPLIFRLLIFFALLLVSAFLLKIPRENPKTTIEASAEYAREVKQASAPDRADAKFSAKQQAKRSSISGSSVPAVKNQNTEGFDAVVLMSTLLDEGKPLDALREARRLCRNPDRNVRLSAVEALRWIGLPAAMDVAAMIDDSDEQIREIARDAFWNILRGMEAPPLKKDLLEIALRSNDPKLRIDVLDELLYLPDELSIDLLSRAVNDPDKAVAEQAQQNLSFITGEDIKEK